MLVCVCVWVYYLCFLCRQKNFYHKKITALVLSRLEKSKRNVSQKYKKEVEKTQRDTAASSAASTFLYARHVFAFTLCLLGVFVRVCMCVLQLPADSSKRLPCAAAGFILCLCVCVSVAPFTVFHNSFRGGAQKHSFVLLLMHYTVSRKYNNLVYLFIVPSVFLFSVFVLRI